MRRTELQHRKAYNPSVQPSHCHSQPQQQGSLNNDIEARIVTLYTTGQSIESITREVGRARHRVVHVLQARGVFGRQQLEPVGEATPNSPPTIEKYEEISPIEEHGPDPTPPGQTERQVGRNHILRKAKPALIAESPQRVPPAADTKRDSLSPTAPKPRVPRRWSPQVMEALCRVSMQLNVYPGRSFEEVCELLAKSKR